MMKQFLKNKREILLWVVALALFAIIVIYSVISVRFITNSIQAALGGNLINLPTVATFNLDALEELIAIDQ